MEVAGEGLKFGATLKQIGALNDADGRHSILDGCSAILLSILGIFRHASYTKDKPKSSEHIDIAVRLSRYKYPISAWLFVGLRRGDLVRRELKNHNLLLMLSVERREAIAGTSTGVLLAADTASFYGELRVLR